MPLLTAGQQKHTDGLHLICIHYDSRRGRDITPFRVGSQAPVARTLQCDTSRKYRKYLS